MLDKKKYNNKSKEMKQKNSWCRTTKDCLFLSESARNRPRLHRVRASLRVANCPAASGFVSTSAIRNSVGIY